MGEIFGALYSKKKSILFHKKGPFLANIERCPKFLEYALASDKAKLFAENFSKNSDLDDSGISLLIFPSETNLKLDNISVTPKMVKKVITNLDSSKASGPDCIPVVALKNCEFELSFTS